MNDNSKLLIGLAVGVGAFVLFQNKDKLPTGDGDGGGGGVMSMIPDFSNLFGGINLPSVPDFSGRGGGDGFDIGDVEDLFNDFLGGTKGWIDEMKIPDFGNLFDGLNLGLKLPNTELPDVGRGVGGWFSNLFPTINKPTVNFPDLNFPDMSGLYQGFINAVDFLIVPPWISRESRDSTPESKPSGDIIEIDKVVSSKPSTEVIIVNRPDPKTIWGGAR